MACNMSFVVQLVVMGVICLCVHFRIVFAFPQPKVGPSQPTGRVFYLVSWKPGNF